MRFDVLYDPKAEKQLEKLPKQISKRIILKIGEAGKTGRGIEPIKDEGYGYKIRIGGYRAIVDLTYNPDTIWVRFVGHRNKIYKRI